MEINVKLIVIGILFAWSNNIAAQLSNDECDFATFIPLVDEYCSQKNEFTNAGATQSSQGRPNCWPQNTEDSDVWFSFIPKNLGVFIQVTGLTVLNAGTLQNPSVTIYTGNCNNLTELACGSVLTGENVVELTLSDLNIGGLYYIRIDGRSTNVGTFKLCINTFAPIKAPEADCKDGVILCDKEEIFVEDLVGIGKVTNEVDTKSCIEAEFASVWYKWTCKDAGNLTFTIIPNNKQDDIDFALYKLPGGLDDCNNKQLIRCMASGETIGADPTLNSPCFGPTGLNTTATDVVEEPGCQNGDDNFLDDVNMVPGESFVLLINNFSQSGFGFSIKFGGTGTFLGPEADFDIATLDRFECDKSVLFTNLSSSETDSIISYKWSFGDESSPNISNDFGPIDVTYASFGPKTAALTVESLRGCTVTKIKDLFINPCCKDTTNLSVLASSINIDCFEFETGVIDALGRAGSPKYTYSLDTINFQPSPRFSNLPAGEYTVYIQDKKGCRNQVQVFLTEPPPVIADAGPDIEVELGDGATLFGGYTGGTGISNAQWVPVDSIRNPDEFVTDLLPLRNTTYTLTATDENGCTGTDVVQIRVKVVRNVYSPNIINANNPGPNGIFRLEGGKSVSKVKRLEIYDRWGSKLFKGTDIDIKNFDEGWDATLNGKRVVNGVYVWIALVEFIDGEEIYYTGDVTVID